MRAVMEGGCVCGAVRYRVEGQAQAAGICHCLTCRKIASAPSLPFATFAADRFRWTAGEPSAFRSSTSVTRTFCGCCGSPLTYRSDAQPEVLDVMIVSLDEPDAVTPDFHVWTSAMLGWDRICDGLATYPQSRQPAVT